MRVAIKENYFDKDNSFLFWNPIAGRCEYKCRYCRTQGKGRPALRPFVDLNEKNPRMVSVALGYAELWGQWILDEWISKVLAHCRTYDGTYTFMTKNPQRYRDFLGELPSKTILGATIETNRDYRLSKAPPTRERMEVMASLPSSISKSVRLSPLADFDLDDLLSWMERISPTDVRVSPEWYGTRMARPSKEKTTALIKDLVKIAGVVILEPGNVIVGGKIIGGNHGKNFANEKATRGDEPLYEDEDVTFVDTKFIREREEELAAGKEGWDLLFSSNRDI